MREWKERRKKEGRKEGREEGRKEGRARRKVSHFVYDIKEEWQFLCFNSFLPS